MKNFITGMVRQAVACESGTTTVEYALLLLLITLLGFATWSTFGISSVADSVSASMQRIQSGIGR